jgi:hypothetical protein
VILPPLVFPGGSGTHPVSFVLQAGLLRYLCSSSTNAQFCELMADSLSNKSSSLAAALGVTKFVTIIGHTLL